MISFAMKIPLAIKSWRTELSLIAKECIAKRKSICQENSFKKKIDFEFLPGHHKKEKETQCANALVFNELSFLFLFLVIKEAGKLGIQLFSLEFSSEVLSCRIMVKLQWLALILSLLYASQ